LRNYRNYISKTVLTRGAYIAYMVSMELEHIAMYVEDLEGARKFYEKYFGGTANAKYRNPKTGLETYFISFDGGARLEIMTRPKLLPHAGESMCMGLAHIAFKLESEDAVNTLTRRLADDGFAVVSAPRTTGDGCYESCIKDPEGNLVEITA